MVDLSHFLVVCLVFAYLLRRNQHLVLLVKYALNVLLLALHVLIDHHFGPIVTLDDLRILDELFCPYIILQLTFELGCTLVV